MSSVDWEAGWTAAKVLATALLTGMDVEMVRQWRRTKEECPWWCASDHQCTARPDLEYPSPDGIHRASPKVWVLSYGKLVAQRMRRRGKTRSSFTVTVNVRLDADEMTAHRQAQHLAIGIDLTVRAVLGTPEHAPQGPLVMPGSRITMRPAVPAELGSGEQLRWSELDAAAGQRQIAAPARVRQLPRTA